MSLIARICDSQIFRFAFVGGTAFFVSEAVLYIIIKALHVDAYTAAILTFVVAVTYTWLGNRILTFRDNAAHGARAVATEWAKFVAANLVGFVANYAVYSALLMFARPPLNSPFLALVCGTLVGLVFNFILSKRLVFRAPAA